MKSTKLVWPCSECHRPLTFGRFIRLGCSDFPVWKGHATGCARQGIGPGNHVRGVSPSDEQREPGQGGTQ